MDKQTTPKEVWEVSSSLGVAWLNNMWLLLMLEHGLGCLVLTA